MLSVSFCSLDVQHSVLQIYVDSFEQACLRGSYPAAVQQSEEYGSRSLFCNALLAVLVDFNGVTLPEKTDELGSVKKVLRYVFLFLLLKFNRHI